MSDEANKAETTDVADTVETATTADQAAAQPSLEDLQKEVEKWKGLSRKHESTAKANSAAQKRLTEIEDAQKSETQKLTDQLTAAQVRLNELEVIDARSKAARDAGLDADMADYLTAADYESALEQAKRLAEKLAPKAPTAPDFKQGARRQAAKPSADGNDWLRNFASGR